MFNYQRRDMYGRIRTINGESLKNDPVGYCHCNKHKGYLTAADWREHECQKKNCCWLEKNDNHPYWKQLENEKKKAASKKKKAALYRQIKDLYYDGKIDVAVKRKLEQEMSQGHDAFVIWYLTSFHYIQA